MDLLQEDLGYFDLTTLGLGIEKQKGKMGFYAKSEIIVCGVCEVADMLKKCSLDYVIYKNDGEIVKSTELVIECVGLAKGLHGAWKISQNTLEYLSAIATTTHKMVTSAKKINPKIEVATTRKNFPGAKKLMTKAVLAGGGTIHRLGLYDSILVFKEHLAFINDVSEAFSALKGKFLEKKITIEVNSFEEAKYYATLGADILQCEKMSFEELAKCVSLKKDFAILVSATGGINESNVADYAKTGVDFLATSAPYHAKPIDIKVVMEKIA